jgi:hypothetical protein
VKGGTANAVPFSVHGKKKSKHDHAGGKHMPQTADAPAVRPGGQVTVAFLKAQLDGGSDHLGIFMPLVLDVLGKMSSQSCTAQDVKEALAEDHGVEMPQPTVATLLKRATKAKYLYRESGRYWRNPAHALPISNVSKEKVQISEGQQRFAAALRSHAARRGLLLESTDAAMELLFRFLEEEQVAMLLGSSPISCTNGDPSARERAVVAEFVQDSVKDDPALLSVLRGMLEGLVLYHAAFLPDLNFATRRFKDLRVVFDSTLVRQALGYEGPAMQTLMRETLDVLKAGGVQCLVLDKSVNEIQRILSMYESRLGTAEGRRSLKSLPMDRYFLTQRYSPSDIREMSALLEREIGAAGFQILRSPARVREYTGDEKSLAARLADPSKRDELEPRVVHDVDCVAAILTLRRNHRTVSLDDARAVFATSSPRVIRNVRLWWEQDEHETGIEPVVHIRALANLAWLKKPAVSSDFKVRELVALCAAALRPSQQTWERFKRHLESLQRSNRVTSDEVTAILVSAMSDKLLRDAEFEEDDPADIDAVTLDEVVSRVTESYAASAEKRIETLANEYDRKLAQTQASERAALERAVAAERAASETVRRHELLVEGRARKWARLLTRGLRWIATCMVLAGALALVIGHPFHGGWVGTVVGIAVVIFVTLEALGILGHVAGWCDAIEVQTSRGLRRWLEGQA